MENIITRENIIFVGKEYSLNMLALVFIYITPALSHLVGYPIYYFEPMRVFLIFTMVHLKKKNAYILALTLPLFSFIVSAHPSIVKMALITTELSINVFLFYILSGKIKNKFISIFLSISISKIIYYSIKYLLINTSMLNSGLISTPILLQFGTTLVLSGYAYYFITKKKYWAKACKHKLKYYLLLYWEYINIIVVIIKTLP